MSRVAIIDFGSQFTQLLARRIRELNVYSEIFPHDIAFDYIKDSKAFILSGGPKSVLDFTGMPPIVHDIIELNKKTSVPVLGVCYGLQLLSNYFNSTIVHGCGQEFGKAILNVVKKSEMIKDVWKVGDQPYVWMSHADSVYDTPCGFEVIACSVVNNAIAMISNEERRIYGVQFHPEVYHTPDGVKLLANFVRIAGCDNNWTVESFLDEQENLIKKQVGDKKVIAALSGGVDSSVAAALTYRAIGDQLHCIFIDNGLLRYNEAEKVRQSFVDQFQMPVTIVDRSSVFLDKLQFVTDPEQKRKIIGKTFIEVFEEEANKIGNVEFLMQGTIYPDVIESGGSVGKESVTIKSHHNVGGLPDIMKLQLVEPLKLLFKDEVRLLGKKLGISDEILMRHPFPGPGLAIRIIGEITQEKVNMLQAADEIYINLIKKYNLYDVIWQAFAVLLPVKTVGVMGDSRTYGYTCALRAVTSSDGMTAECFPFGVDLETKIIFYEFLQDVSNTIVNNVQGINRVVYDTTSKPPATIEWE
ncbi:GMP synthase (glutamine-hydrolyzing) [Ehrlichia chaffeensis str. Heartland]|uniref:GMP synthase [glutamine-hydrolyzing] n=1 Tax=Ehrlichia chaffeensis (strain ATCC CRL-10679 / Arkansas) TaxID=205920 RepID=GUAA_EHRCR|nr:glutamine-hydrolyzing GMP synthase [Ehrlichia chaffeensis]Q2GHY2.1 RecName: Full=GMP synthase [glutamine-hydrolyzing]; AltName: Full=GMP synthetase; AltName: Full=Glutamine amidotransferase [Ehrlichia chaffeensis str. Arkansas]ABD45456.1 GMP synthase [Ehrlichia chaffeensis str. Arkansas]AHX04081.1 GMP synthase (glutamine-hydrolyzing) [Ehrlichia chaffeensis str. Heartland]AHX06014.1 GMP synthase [Ehrlichia chaffeensis str. Jax]AHX07004.1 GMP synthase [Ehrlichia chaffeensis str. Liberty]AHX0